MVWLSDTSPKRRGQPTLFRSVAIPPARKIVTPTRRTSKGHSLAGASGWCGRSRPRHNGATSTGPGIRRFTMSDPSEALAKGVQARHAGQLFQAEQLYRLVLQADPAHGEALATLGEEYLAQGRWA